MSTLTVGKCRTADGAENVGTALKSLLREGALEIVDDAVDTGAGRRVTSGPPALFPLTPDEVPGRVGEVLPAGGVELPHGDLGPEREAALREISGDEAG
ncbi:hypothetical protein ABZ172_11285 [Streptomyces sp. NPDC006296]|uniref:hypothetical protein n=1 Tax=Streptomyces sp. NPDC006296 TaxID=3156746 RepID=UPI0033AD08BE